MLVIQPSYFEDVLLRVPASPVEQVIRIAAVAIPKPSRDNPHRKVSAMGFDCADAVEIRRVPARPQASVEPAAAPTTDARSSAVAQKDPKPTPKKPTASELAEHGIDTDNRDG